MTHEDFDASAPESTSRLSEDDFDSAATTSLSPDSADAEQQWDDVEDDDQEASPNAEGLPSAESSADQTEPASGEFQPAGSEEELDELEQPFVGRWNTLISTTNWEKGRIVSQWRDALIEAGAPVTQYSDEAWAARVGGVTAPHVGRLRRVWDRFNDSHETYSTLYWSHFLAALDWDDAALWLQGAVEDKWSVSQMREQRWKSNGEVESDRPTSSQIVEVDMDEDTPDLGTAPAQGATPKDFDGDTDGIASGPAYEPPDFGDEEGIAKMGDGNAAEPAVAESPAASIQPFANLPALPDDMSDAIESLKLSILRHKTAGFEDVQPDTIKKYLDAVALLME